MLHTRPKATSVNVSKAMRGNRSSDTKPELELRKALREAGEPGYRLHWSLPGKPDIAYPGRRVAIFVQGCYWHSCPVCAKVAPRKNVDYWTAKLQYNKDRDMLNQSKIAEIGWAVIVVWECEIRKKLAESVQRILHALQGDG